MGLRVGNWWRSFARREGSFIAERRVGESESESERSLESGVGAKCWNATRCVQLLHGPTFTRAGGRAVVGIPPLTGTECKAQLYGLDDYCGTASSPGALQLADARIAQAGGEDRCDAGVQDHARARVGSSR